MNVWKHASKTEPDIIPLYMQICLNVLTLFKKFVWLFSDIFRSQLTPNKYQRQRLKESCELTSPKVFECVKDVVKVTPAKNTLKRKYLV